jgi:quercetin dioxygenase-like cupin family protein
MDYWIRQVLEVAMAFPADGYHLSVGEGDSWWFLHVRYDVKIAAEQTGGTLTFMEFVAPAGFGPPRHLHESEDEAFYVIEGAMRVVCGSKTWDASAGSLVFLPRGIEHAFIVTGDTPIRGLQLTNPSGFEDFVAEIGKRPEGPGLPPPAMPDIQRLDEAGRRGGRIIVGPPMTLD